MKRNDSLKLTVLLNYCVVIMTLIPLGIHGQSWSPSIRGQLVLGLSDLTGSGEGIYNRRPTSASGKDTHLYGIALFTNSRTRMVIDNNHFFLGSGFLILRLLDLCVILLECAVRVRHCSSV